MAAEPAALVAIAAAAWLYWHGLGRLWSRADASRPVLKRRATLFFGGLVITALALESPLDDLSARLFAVHMLQHLLLLLVAAPLLVVGAPLALWMWALPAGARHPIGAILRRLAWLENTFVAFALHSLALWTWHFPALYDAALSVRAVHVLEHASFLGTAALFWWTVARPRSNYGVGTVCVFGLAVQSNMLGALLTFAPAAWYAAHAQSATAFGVTPLEDQQIAGLVMWVPGGLVYLVAALALLYAWLTTPAPAAHMPDREAHIRAHQ